MFSLIIAIIAIVIVVAIIVATMYNGGDSLTQGKDAADAAGLVNASAQINSALTMYRADHGSNPVGSSDEIKQVLVDQRYLASFPLKDSWNFVDGYAMASGLTEAQCLAINKRHGVDNIPNCSDALNKDAICCNE